MLSLELVKTRLAVMNMEMRKNFIQAILTSLIEKSPDAKILRAVVKIVEEWVKNNSPMAANQVRGEELWSGQVAFHCERKFRHRKKIQASLSQFFLLKVLSQAKFFFSRICTPSIIFFLSWIFSLC